MTEQQLHHARMVVARIADAARDLALRPVVAHIGITELERCAVEIHFVVKDTRRPTG